MQGIVLTGEPGSGKSTIANALSGILGWERRSFAWPLKNEVTVALSWANGPSSITSQGYEFHRIRVDMDDPEKKDFYRGILQWWGTEFRRGQDKGYWVKQFDATLSLIQPGYVVDDCRFNNEMKLLKSYDFKFVRLEDGETTRPVRAHASEVDWKTWKYDLALSYERGPVLQAQRIIKELGL